jgi:hypothetical protein
MLGAGAGVRETQGVQGQLTFSKDLSGWGIRSQEKWISFPSKLIVLASSKYAPA